MITLRRGSIGDAVHYAQERLTALGWHLPPDGVFGPLTEAAVRSWQASAGVEPTGMLDSRMWNLLMAPSIEIPDRVKKVLQIAQSRLGHREEPDGSNDGPQIHDIVGVYGRHWKIPDYRPAPWCGMFCGWVINQVSPELNVRWLGGVYGGLGSWEYWARNHDCLRPDPAIGAVLLMGRGPSGSDSAPGGHCGLVLSYDDESVTSCDGNVHNAIGIRTRPRAWITDYVWWWC